MIPQTVQAWQRRPEPPVWVWPGSAATGGRENRRGRETTTKMFKRCFVLFFLKTFIIICRQTQTLGDGRMKECENVIIAALMCSFSVGR